MADRYTYITLIGPFVAVTWGAHDLAARWTRGKEAMAAAALLVVIALAAATFIQAGNLEKQRHPFPSRPCRDGKQFHGPHQSRRGTHRRRQAGRGPPASRDGNKDQARLPQCPVQPRRHRHEAGQRRRGHGSFQGQRCASTPALHGHPITRVSFICSGERPPRPCSTFNRP